MNRLANVCAALLLAACWWMAASVSREHSTTADEIFHITSGYSYWLRDDFRLQPENGNLPQRWAALPLLLQQPRFPRAEQPAWRTADVAELGHQFFYESGNDLPRLLASARAMLALLGAACGLLVFLWSRSLFGPAGALVSLAFYAFCPLVLAHAGLATSDMAVTLGFLCATLTGWRLLHRITPGRVLLAGLAWGGLALAKFSAPLFGGIFFLMAAVRLGHGSPLPVRLGSGHWRLRGTKSALALLGATVAALVVAVAVIWAAYGFRFEGLRDAGSYNHAWADYGQGPAIQICTWARHWHLLPDAWLQGFAHTLFFAGGRPAFFLGEYSSTGWTAFFPVGFLLKTTLPALALLGMAGGLLVRRAGRRLGYRLVPLLALLAVYAAFALTSRLNIGVRHLLPVYPVLYVLAGAVALRFRRRWLAVSVLLLAAWHLGASLAIRPHYIAYFNPLLGGPAKAYHYFVDSSLDWGQDLPGLRRWLAANAGGNRVYLSYFGSGSPAHEGIQATRIGDSFFDLRARELLPEMRGGIYCLSATMFQQVYTLVRHGWSPAHEARYQELERRVAAWRAAPAGDSRAEAIEDMTVLEQYRFGRLCAALQPRTPDAQIGYSILIFRLSDAEVARALAGPPPQ